MGDFMDENKDEELNKLNEEEVKKLNMYQAELRQRSIEKYGRDIYSDKVFGTKGLKRMQKVNRDFEKALKGVLIFFIIFFALFVAYAFLIGWGQVYMMNVN